MWTRMSDIDRMLGAMDLLRSRMNSLFTDYDRSYGMDYGLGVGESVPPTNLYDEGENLKIVAEVPGLKKEDLHIRIQGNYLEISGTRNSDAPEGYKTHRAERGTATFTRSFTLPSEIDSDKVEAKLKNGLLVLVLPKAETAKPKQIAISEPA